MAPRFIDAIKPTKPGVTSWAVELFIAAELLTPVEFLAQDVEVIGEIDLLVEDVIQQLAAKYGVSTQAMTFRLAYLGYIQQ